MSYGSKQDEMLVKKAKHLFKGQSWWELIPIHNALKENRTDAEELDIRRSQPGFLGNPSKHKR